MDDRAGAAAGRLLPERGRVHKATLAADAPPLRCHADTALSDA
jgi:hypothetical protein